ncbi:hypothetical protein KR059_003649 [Drosophila kikkawai]|nr:hypothetical protein KR059_003649 [Drosophila kikkawai]
MFAFIEDIKMQPLGNRKSFTPIVKAEYIGNVGAYIAQTEFNSDVQTALNLQNTFYKKYSILAWKLEEQKTAIIMRLEEAKANMKLVDMFMRKPGEEHQNMMHMTYGVFRWVTIQPVEKVILQANSSTLQMEFALPEAMEFLKKDITKLQQQRLQVDHDIDYLEDQVHVTELNMAVLKKYEMRKQQQEIEGCMASRD